MPDWTRITQDYIQGWTLCDPPPEKDKEQGWAAGVEYDWPELTSSDVVVEVGGYEGRWAAEITKRYSPQIYWFEPAVRAVKVSPRLLGGLDNVHIYPYGLGDRDGRFVLGDDQRDGASFLKTGGAVAQMRDAAVLFTEIGLTAIDLMQINIEGFEFILIPYLIREGYIKKIKWLQIQWHVAWDQADSLQSVYHRDVIRCKISETHEMLWNAGTHEAWQCRT